MKIIICDNCGKEGQENITGHLCENCLGQWQSDHEIVQIKKDALELELKRKYHIK